MKNKKGLLTLVIIFIAANLRGPLTMVGPLIPYLKKSFTCDDSIFGLLTSIPLLGFAVISIIAPKIDNKFGKKATIKGSLILIIIGLIVRSLGLVNTLFIGSILLAIGIGISNVVLPSVIVENSKKDEVGKLTGTFTMTMGLFSAVGSGSSIFLYSILGWRLTFEAFIITTAIALALWIVFSKNMNKKDEKTNQENDIKISTMLKSKLVIAIALFMGIQSWIAYAIFAWVPSILINRGVSASFSALALMTIQLCSMPTMYIIPIIAGKKKSQSKFVTLTTIISLIGCLSLFTSNIPTLIIGLVLMGVGQGASLSFAYLFFAVRSKSSAETSALSGVSQAIGYFLGATGPILFGSIHDITNSWTSSLILMIFMHIILLLVGIISGRDRKI